jgi:hypothetical protein
LLWHPELARWLASEQSELEATGIGRRRATLLRGELLNAATGAGWGVQSTAEVARSADAAIGYVTKLARDHEQTVGEVAKLTQLPLNAPIKSRRFSSGKAFLPPVRHDPDVTGVLIKRIVGHDGHLHAEPVHNVPGKLHGFSSRCSELEERVLLQELQEQGHTCLARAMGHPELAWQAPVVFPLGRATIEPRAGPGPPV